MRHEVVIVATAENIEDVTRAICAITGWKYGGHDSERSPVGGRRPYSGDILSLDTMLAPEYATLLPGYELTT